MSRSGLPTTCGAPLPGGGWCRGPHVGCEDHFDLESRRWHPDDYLHPGSFRTHYRRWLARRGRGDEDVPPDTLRFVNWWAERRLADAPPSLGLIMEPAAIRTHWITWCAETGRERVIPFDLRRFVEAWERR